MSTQTKTVFSAEFKAKIGFAAMKGDKTINQLSQDFPTSSAFSFKHMILLCSPKKPGTTFRFLTKILN